MNSENLFILQPMYGTISILRWMICCVSCHAMINSLWFFYSNDGKINNMIAWFQCFRNSDLHKGRPSTQQFREKLPWFLNALPSADCAKGGHGAYSSSVDLDGLYWIFWVLNKPYYVNILLTSVFMAQKSDFFYLHYTNVFLTCHIHLSGYESGIIQASEFRTYHTPLNKQV